MKKEKKKELKKIRLRGANSDAEVVIRVVKETGEVWHGRMYVDGRWWPPPPNYYIYRKNTQWVKTE